MITIQQPLSYCQDAFLSHSMRRSLRSLGGNIHTDDIGLYRPRRSRVLRLKVSSLLLLDITGLNVIMDSPESFDNKLENLRVNYEEHSPGHEDQARAESRASLDSDDASWVFLVCVQQ